MRLDEIKDLIGKKTPSLADIKKKSDKPDSKIDAQLKKGVKVEREHTKNDAEAREIARDHLDELPDYYDRLEKVEKK
jgi:hypothetical protein